MSTLRLNYDRFTIELQSSRLNDEQLHIYDNKMIQLEKLPVRLDTLKERRKTARMVKKGWRNTYDRITVEPRLNYGLTTVELR